jgi:hypothetical protein
MAYHSLLSLVKSEVSNKIIQTESKKTKLPRHVQSQMLVRWKDLVTRESFRLGDVAAGTDQTKKMAVRLMRPVKW